MTSAFRAPMIRVGERGSGQWRKAGWDEALDLVAEKLGKVIDEYGSHSVVLGERTQLATHVSKTFHESDRFAEPFHPRRALQRVGQHRLPFPFRLRTDSQIGIHYKKTKHIVLYGRNIFESISVKEVNNLMHALENGARMTYIDPRVTVTATKAHRYWMIRPGTDLAFNYALIHVILKERLYQADYVTRWVTWSGGTAGFRFRVHARVGRRRNRHRRGCHRRAGAGNQPRTVPM
jgi:thiosulfate reductase/polysulfide reductase chain A